MLDFDKKSGYFARAVDRILSERTLSQYEEFWDEADTCGSIRIHVLLNKDMNTTQRIPAPRIEEVFTESEITALANLLGFQKAPDGSWPINCDNYFVSSKIGLADWYADLWFSVTSFPARPR
jgi:hypothetical protein